MFALGVPSVPYKLSIENFEVRRGSPFNRAASTRSVALMLSDGHLEIFNITDCQLERSAAGVVSCRALRGRCRAEFGVRALRKQFRMVTGE